jgi:predicted transposase YbfD/YdcC
MCQSIREVGDGKSSFDVRLFIGSKRAKARYYAQRMRGHWRVENNLHWQLDVTFREDDNRVRQRAAATNFATVRRLALNLTKQEDDEHRQEALRGCTRHRVHLKDPLSRKIG